ncbi:MAG: MarR family transcriptional regulator [Streptosporangiaceae bacterium]
MTRWLDDDEQEAWRAYLWSTQLIFDHLERQMQREGGIPHTYYVIMAMLSEAPDRSLTMTQLARLTRGSASRLSHAVGKLERNGWVRRVKHPDDARTNIATLTDEGSATVEAHAPGHVAAVREALFDQLTPEQVDQLKTISQAVLDKLEPRLTPPGGTAAGSPPGPA